jgi:hypothetical protein
VIKITKQKLQIQQICHKEAEIAEIHTIVKRIEKQLLGNGRPGMVEEWNQTKGAIKFVTFLASSSAVAATISLIVQLI